MTDYLLSERPTKRVFYGSTNMFDEDDDEQYFAFSKAAADSEFSIVGVTNSAIMPNNDQGSLDGGEKSGSTMELTSSVNSHDSMSIDDVKINTSINKGTSANVDVPNVGCKAEPSSKENAENIDGNKIGKSNPSKSPSSTSSSQPTTTPSSSSQPPTTTTNNKKRTRATPEQLAILEDTFKTNTSPNSKVREALAEKVNMSERSIQIWFQNRRAKMKAMQKRAHLMINQDAIGHFMTCMPNYGPYPFRMPIHPQRIPLPRSYSAGDLTPALNNVALAGMRPQPNSGLGITVPQVPQGFWPSGPLTAPITSLGGSDSSHLMSGFPFSANHIVNPQQAAQRFPTPNASPNTNAMNATQAIRLVSPTGGIPIKMNDQSSSISQPQQFTPPQEYLTPTFNNNQVSVISCDTLSIGTWRRILTMQAPTDLLCYYTIPQNLFTYHITNENTQFKMEFPLTDITSIEYRSVDEIHSQIAVEVKDTPHFYMESPQGGWSMCRDFTEDRQATRHMRHVMRGRAVVMKPQLIKLMQDCPPLAKVVNILDTPAENQNLEGNNDAGKQTNEQDQQNPPRRSSFPSGSIADNLRFGEGRCSSVPGDKSNILLKQIDRTRRSASVPVSPTDDKSPSLVSSAMTPNASAPLQVNTSSTLLDLYKTEVNSSPEFCSSPMELNSTSSPSTPLYVFDNSPTIMDSSPLLNQDPFVSLPSQNLNSLTMDSSSLLSSEQLAAMVGFTPGNGLSNVSNDDFSSMFNMSSGSDTASDVSEFLTFSDFPSDAMGENKDGFSSTSSMVNLDVSSWVGGDVYC